MFAGRWPTAVLGFFLCGLAVPTGFARQSSRIDVGALVSLEWRPLGPDDQSLTSLAADAAFPYRLCGSDDSGATRCRTVHAGPEVGPVWEPLPLGNEERVTPDPLEPEVVLTSGLRRFDRRTRQATWIGPELADQLRGRRLDYTLAFSADGRTLFSARRGVWRSGNGGQNWLPVSPDLLGAHELSSPVDRITALAISPIDSRILWAGTSRGSLHVTRDGGTTWSSVTTPTLPSTVAVAGIETSRFDPQSVYVTTAEGSEGSSTLWRTRNHGSSWTNLGLTLPRPVAFRAVREDPLRRGLLFAAADTSVLFSIDDGETWQAVGSNLPTAPVTDILIRDSDLVVGTRGQGAWLLEDFSPLRQVTADVLRADAFLFRPAQSWRTRASSMPSPVPAGTEPDRNATNGVAIAYLAPTAPGPFSIEIIETATGETIRRYSTEQSERQPGDRTLSRSGGVQRIVWDLRYARPEPDPTAPEAARVLPGTYQVRLSTVARSLRQSVAIRMDPRVRASVTDLAAQRTLARALDLRRAELARSLQGRASGSTGPSTSDSEIKSGLDELRRLTRAVNDVDARPSAALESAAADALARTAALLVSR